MGGDVGVFVICTIMALITSLGLILGWINYKINKCKDEINDIYVGKENAAAAVGVLEGLIRNLNAVCHDHQKRLDILEEGHPDSEIDYGTVDNDGNITEVWFEGKRYVPEDKRDEDNVAFYADGRVVAETTRPEEKRCCATCQHYRPESGYSTCDLRTWLHVTKAYANNTHSACNNYEKLVLYKTYNGILPDDKTEELQKRVADLNYFYNVGLMSAATYMHRWEELMNNDS